MKWLNKLMKMAILFLPVIISSCALPKQNTSWLAGRVYVNEETLDKIEFITKRKCVFTLVSFTDWPKGYPTKFPYEVDMASSQALSFPYRILKFSDSKEEIFFFLYDYTCFDKCYGKGRYFDECFDECFNAERHELSGVFKRKK